MMKRINTLLALAFVCLGSLSAHADIDATLTPSALDLGDVPIGSSASANATIGIDFNGMGDLAGNANNGSVTSVSIINPVGGGLSASQSCVGVDFSASRPDQECIVEVTCTPTAVGAVSGDLQIQFDLLNNAGVQTQTASLSCNGTDVVPSPADVGIPTLGGFSLALLGLLLAAFAWVGFRQQQS